MMTDKTQCCIVCGQSPLSKDEVGVSKKLLGKKIEVFFCLPCLADYLDTTVDDLNNKIEEFKDQGCKLF
jgi:hypothetical protein